MLSSDKLAKRSEKFVWIKIFLRNSLLYSLFIFYDTYEIRLLVKEMRNERD